MNEQRIRAGESWFRKVTVYSDADQTDLVDITGAEVFLQVFDAPGGVKIWDGSAEVSNGGQGEIDVSLAASQTAERPSSVLFWVVRAELSGNRVVDLDSGRLVISA